MGNSPSTLLQSLEPGDRVSFQRAVIKHYGIYIGGGKVIHLTGQGEGGLAANIHSRHLCSISGVRDAKCVIRIDNIQDVANGDEYYKDNSRDDSWGPLDMATIIRRARKYLNHVVPYNLFNSNCEHFVNWCRYDQRESDQARNAIIGTATSVVLVGAVAVAGVLAYAVTRRDEEKVKK